MFRLAAGHGCLKAIATLHGGQVAVRSEGRGQGSEFTLSLPRCNSAGTVHAAVALS